jgi:hypothetical protein
MMTHALPEALTFIYKEYSYAFDDHQANV